MAIAKEYGRRLMEKSKNFEEETLQALISSYPSHSFVIDREEAATKFKIVRACTPDEIALLEDLENFALNPSSGWVKFISDDIIEEDQANAASQTGTVLEQPGPVGDVASPTGDIPPGGQAGATTGG